AALLASRDALALADRYRPLSDLGIACTGAVGSVLLLSRVPISALSGRRVSLTGESRTSRALLRILLADAFGLRDVRYQDGRGGDARLVIGDRALALAASGEWPHVLDLGAEWTRATGLPFVYARWVVRRDLCEQRARDLAAALDHSLSTPVDVAAAPRPPGLGVPGARAYLERFVHHLGPAESAGLLRFQRELERHDLLRHHRPGIAIGSAA
ncbi:MAG: menaquinone biosynthesis protein, partial [Myxococcales bacterium]|nr:menaquinone biosynthesis protein [Myxococcales bacterium]